MKDMKTRQNYYIEQCENGVMMNVYTEPKTIKYPVKTILFHNMNECISYLMMQNQQKKPFSLFARKDDRQKPLNQTSDIPQFTY